MYKKQAGNLKFLHRAVNNCVVGNTRGAGKVSSFPGSDRLRFKVNVPNSGIPGSDCFFESVYGLRDS